MLYVLWTMVHVSFNITNMYNVYNVSNNHITDEYIQNDSHK